MIRFAFACPLSESWQGHLAAKSQLNRPLAYLLLSGCPRNWPRMVLWSPSPADLQLRHLFFAADR